MAFKKFLTYVMFISACTVLFSCASDYSEDSYEEVYTEMIETETATEPETTAINTTVITQPQTDAPKLYSLPEGVDPVTWQPSPKHLVIDTDEARQLYARIKAGSYPTMEELEENNIISQLDELSMYYLSLYGNTSYIDTPERRKLREDIKEQFLSSGSARADGKNIAYDGELEKDYQMEIVLGLPSSEKSKISDADSEEMKAFILDDIFIKQLIPEFQESYGCAADAVLYEVSNIMDEAINEFLEGDMKGTNIIFPAMAKDLNSLTKNYIKPFEKAGYNIKIKFSEYEENIGISRCIATELETGNILNSVLLFSSCPEPLELFEELTMTYNSYGELYCTPEPPTEEETTEEETEEESEEEEDNPDEEQEEEQHEESPEENQEEIQEAEPQQEQHEEEQPQEETESEENTE